MFESELAPEEFPRLLFRMAFCLVACDGEIHDLEIQELKEISKNTPYFGEIDLDSEMKRSLADFEKFGTRTIHDLFHTLETTKLSMVQELLLLEVALRVIDADKHVDASEIQFVKAMRWRLDVLDPLIVQRFGQIPYLVNSEQQEMPEVGKLSTISSPWKEKVHLELNVEIE